MWDNAARRVVFICGHTTSPFAVGSRVPPSPRVLCRVYQAGFSDRHVGHSVVRPAEMDVWGTRRVSAGHAGSPRVYQAARASSIHRTEATAPKKKARFPGLFCERGTGLEPATLSLGNTRSTAWIGRLRSTMRKRTRWNPLEPARAGWSLAHAKRAVTVQRTGGRSCSAREQRVAADACRVQIQPPRQRARFRRRRPSNKGALSRVGAELSRRQTSVGRPVFRTRTGKSQIPR
jgi:hypothetical protein